MGTLSVVLLVLFIIIVAVCLLTLFLIAPSRGCREGREHFMHLNLAHRGLHTADKSVPENSMAAFRAAVEAGYGIELDLQFSKDEQIVVFHDDTLNRVCGIDARVDAFSYEELQAFRIENTDERIPLFSDVLALVDGKVPLLVEFKNGPKNDLLCSKTLPMLRAYKGLFCIESFSPFIVRWFKKNAPDILRGQLSAPKYELEKELSPFIAWLLSHLLLNILARPHFVAYHKEKTYFLVKLCDKMGAMRFVWTVRPADDYKQLESINDCLIFEKYRPPVRY